MPVVSRGQRERERGEFFVGREIELENQEIVMRVRREDFAHGENPPVAGHRHEAARTALPGHMLAGHADPAFADHERPGGHEEVRFLRFAFAEKLAEHQRRRLGPRRHHRPRELFPRGLGQPQRAARPVKRQLFHAVRRQQFPPFGLQIKLDLAVIERLPRDGRAGGELHFLGPGPGFVRA